MGGPNFWGEPILQRVWIIWSPLLYFNFKTFMEPNSSSLIRFQCILHDSGVVFSESWNFYKLKREEPNLQKVWIIWSPLLYFNFKSFMEPNSSSFMRVQCILHDSRVPFSESWNFSKLKRGDLISGGTNFAESLNYLVPLLYFNFKSFMHPNSSSLIRFQCVLHNSGVLFSV